MTSREGIKDRLELRRQAVAVRVVSGNILMNNTGWETRPIAGIDA